MRRGLYLVLSIVVALAAGGCAHPISLQADSGALVGAGGGVKIDRKVALAISDSQKSREVTTPGGGGDKVSYFPYRDLETGLYVALSETFSGVTKVGSATDPKVAQDGVALVFVPEITTTSYSPSPFTWPPTVFTVELDVAVRTAANAPVTQIRVQGEGRAEFDEFKSDFSLSAKRAAQDAVRKLIKVIQDNAAKLR
jgi:hypothetical protein